MATLSNAMKSFRTAAVVGAGAMMACSVPFSLANAQSTPPTLVAGQCLPMAEMNAALRAEGQRTIIIGDRVAVVDERRPELGVRRHVNTVTSNEGGSLGYQLEGNLPSGQPSTEVCVAAKLTEVQLFDARRDGVPQAALLGGRFDTFVTNASADGVRPMVVARTVFGDAANPRYGRPIVILGDVTERVGLLATPQDSSAPLMLVQFDNLAYTPVGLSRLGTPQVATLSFGAGGR